MKAPVTMHKAEKYAIDPKSLTDDIRTFFLKNMGCSRKVYNLFVGFLYDALEKAGYTGNDVLPDIKLPEVTTFKAEYLFLKEADSLALANEKLNFQKAIRRFNEEHDHKTYTASAIRRDKSGKEALSFRGLKGMPKFHSKAQGYFSYTTNCQYPAEGKSLKNPTIRLEKKTLYLPKLKSGIRLIIHRPLPENAVIGNVTISMDTNGRFYAAVEYSYIIEIDMQLRDAALSGDASIIPALSFLGLDYSQPDFYVDSEGRKANYPHYYRLSEEKLARLQRRLSHMQKNSCNYQKQLKEIRKLHTKIRNQRLDFVRKEAAYLASRYDVVVVEDIDLRAMGQALTLGKNLHDNGFGMFRDILARKLEVKGSVLVKVDRFYASTKTCSCCGEKNPEVRLGMSRWICPVCGTAHIRDENAAINICEEGKRVFLEYFTEWLAKDEQSRTQSAALRAARRKKKTVA